MDLDTAVALITEDEARARAALHELWVVADAGGDAPAAWHAAVAMLLAMSFEFVDFRGRVDWCRRFRSAPAGQDIDTWVVGARQGHHPAMRACAAYLAWPLLDDNPPPPAETLLAVGQALADGLRTQAAMAPGERFLLTKCLLDHHGQQMDTLAVARLIALEQDRLRSQPPAPAVLAQWWFLVMSHHEYFGDTSAAVQARQRLQSLIDAHGLPDARFALLVGDMPLALKAGQLGRAERIHRELEALIPEARAGFLPHGLRAQASFLAQRGDCAAALMRIDRLLALCTDLEVPERDRGAYHVLRANVLTGLGRFGEARDALAALHRHQSAAQRELLAVIEAFTEAAARLDSQPDEAIRWLTTALAGAARLQFSRFFLTLPDLAARLCQVALDAGIEPEFVRSTIRDRHLCPPDPTRADWPWRLRVQVLGELAVWRDDLPLRSTGKAQRKPQELLALLAAHGGGPLDAHFIIDALWPSLDADAPRASLEMAVSRLRKLLDLPDAVAVVEGAVSLAPALVWIDAGAFDTLADQLLAGLAEGRPDAVLAPLADRLLELYSDRLLGSETLAGPLRLARERLALGFLRAVTGWGNALEARGDWRGAIALYERALTRELLSEPIYRALMRAHLAQGERAEALRIFLRCRELLASVLGTAPGAETLALFHTARSPT